ncbi:hypothetical protein TWF694_004726 [Orbilia ellipsospora]|uniref:DUF7918 domain-containing protein n=1 Tax=Orbilia ellipsospora TaxID=2528407 RepID=A0AAV9WW10_9PEZI
MIGMAGTTAARHDIEFRADGELLRHITIVEKRHDITHAYLSFNGHSKMLKLCFGRALLVEDESGDTEKRKDILESIGRLEIKIWRAHLQINGTFDYTYPPYPTANPISEVSVKGQPISHRTELIQPVIASPTVGYYTQKIDEYANPWVTFVFNYHSEELLQSKEAIPVRSSGSVVDGGIGIEI